MTLEIESHPYLGKPVTRTYHEYAAWARFPKIVTERGIVELRTKYTQLPLNIATCKKPPVGSYFVRAVKKDGTIGKKIHDRVVSQSWRLENE